MTRWPSTIPHDLDLRLSTRTSDAPFELIWEDVRLFMDVHVVHMETGWPHRMPSDLKADLERLHNRRAPIANSDRWGVIHEWLERHDVAAPAQLRTRPEIETR